MVHVNSGGDDALELVVDRDLPEATLHLGCTHAWPGTVPFAGVTYPLSPSADLYVEYVGGRDSLGALGCEWGLGNGLGGILSGINDLDGTTTIYFNVNWSNG